MTFYTTPPTLPGDAIAMPRTNTRPHHSHTATAMQLSSPPDSSSSSSPSSFIDTVVQSTSSNLSPIPTTPPLRQSASSFKCRTISDFDISMSSIRTNPQRSSTFVIYEDVRPWSESDISNSTIAEVSNRMVPQSPSNRPRSSSHLSGKRPLSMIVSGERYPQHYIAFPPRQNGGNLLPTPKSVVDTDPSSGSRQSSSEYNFFGETGDADGLESNKRQKSAQRGVEGRKARTVASHQKPPLRRSSTGSYLSGEMLVMNLAGDSTSIGQKAQEQRHTLHDNHSIHAWAGEVWDEGNELLQSPSLKKVSRQPLMDISSKVAVDTSPTVVLGAMPLGPLMIRQPRQTSSRQRLKILDPFPMNPSYWNEYAEDTLNYLLEIEGRYDRYMYKGPDVDFPSHRATLVQWLVELCYGCFSYQPNTLHIAVNLLDRYLSAHGVTLVPLDQLQCVGMCALMIAGKMEENTIKLEIFELCRLCDLYTPRQIASTELSILVALKFEVLVSSASGFSDYFKRAISAPPMVIELIDFLCDLSLISYKFLDFSNSQIAAAAVWIALCAIHQDWSEELAILTGYSRTDLTPCSMLFRELVCSQIDTVDLRSTLGHKYPLEQILATLTYVLQ